MENFGYYVFMLVVLIVGIVILKRVATCLVRTIVTLVVVAILAAIHYYCFRT